MNAKSIITDGDYYLVCIFVSFCNNIYAWLKNFIINQRIDGSLQIRVDGTGCCGSILQPPIRGLVDLAPRARHDAGRQRHAQPRFLASSENNSSAEMPSSRSASAKASSSSACRCAVRLSEWLGHTRTPSRVKPRLNYEASEKSGCG